jgi:catalase
MTAPQDMGGYVHYQEKVDGHKVRERSESFRDHYSQAKLFWSSMTEPEKQHIIEAFHFELGKVETKDVRQRMVDHLANIDDRLAHEVSKGIGIAGPSSNASVLSDNRNAVSGKQRVDHAASLSMENTRKDTILSRRIAILASDGVDGSLQYIKQALEAAGATVEVVSKFLGTVQTLDGQAVKVDKNYLTTGSIMYDAVFLPGGLECVQTLQKHGEALHFINEAFKHCKPIGAISEGIDLLSAAALAGVQLANNDAGSVSDKGVVTAANRGEIDAFANVFITAIAQHRHWEREATKGQVPA